jgi:hypothetical protein
LFPVPEDRLSCAKIVRYWSREVRPQASPRELLNEIVKAYWRGELQPSGAPDRLSVLKSLDQLYRGRITFALAGEPDPTQLEHLPDGGARVLLRVRVPLPSADPGDWSKENCADAFEALAREWEAVPQVIQEDVLPAIVGGELGREQFVTWITKKGFERPRFWQEREPNGNPASQRREAKRAVAAAVEQMFKAGTVPAGHGQLTEIARRLSRKPQFRHLQVETIVRYGREVHRALTRTTKGRRSTKTG